MLVLRYSQIAIFESVSTKRPLSSSHLYFIIAFRAVCARKIRAKSSTGLVRIAQDNRKPALLKSSDNYIFRELLYVPKDEAILIQSCEPDLCTVKNFRNLLLIPFPLTKTNN